MNFISTKNSESGPFTFIVEDGTDPLRSIKVLIVKALQCPKVEILQSNLISQVLYLYLNKDTHVALEHSQSYVVTFTKSSQPSKTGLLLRIPLVADAYQLMQIDENNPYVIEILKSDANNKDFTEVTNSLLLEGQESSPNQSSLAPTQVSNSNTPRDTNKFQQEEYNPVIKNNALESISAWGAKEYASLLANGAWVPPVISMKRPTTALPILPLSPKKVAQYNLSPQNEQNPKDFIVSRYYNTLYSLTTPLSYFPKTAFNRLRNLCKENQEELVDALHGSLLSTENLSKRQAERFGLPSLVGGEESVIHLLKFERENQQHFVSRHYDDLSNDEKLEKLVMDLKIREAQLQVLVIMEVLLCSKINESNFLDGNAKQQEKENQTKAKRSLVRKRNKQKIIPTLLGQGIDDSIPSQTATPQNISITEYSLYKSLLSLIDQLGIWGVFQAKSSSRNDEHTYGFLAYVLVPYYNKALPQIVQFIIKSFKNFQINLKVPKKSASRQSSTSANGNEEGPIEANNKRKLKFSKTHLSPSKLPFLKKSSSTMDASDLKPAFLLKRSKSSLGTKNMQKRQVDMLGKTEKSEEQMEEEVKSQTLFLFCDARKIKSVSMATSSTRELLPQVEATPTKPTLAERAKLNPVNSNVPQVFETPSNVRIIDRLNFENSEIEKSNVFGRLRSSRQKTVFEKLASIEMEDEIVGSPIQLSNSPSNVFLNENNNDIIRSSPEKVISSPLKVTTKPGQQISITSSPVYHGQDGLPKDLRINAKRIKLAPVLPSAKAELKPERKLPKSLQQPPHQPHKTKKVCSKAKKVIEPEMAANRVSVMETAKRQNGNSAISTASASFSSLDIFRETSFTKTQADLESSTNPAKVSSHSFSFNSADTDSDSDLEKLMAAPRAPIRKYPRKK